MKGPLVRKAFELYASGQHSIVSLQAEVARLGLANHQGKPVSKHGIESILNNPFYCGIIEIKRTGAIFEGVHAPLIDAATFRRVADVKAGRAGKKVTRHNHTYRGLFRCGLCAGPMSPELQKGHVYYRCQTRDCATKTIREDRLHAAIQDRLRSLSLSDADARRLETDWNTWIESGEPEAVLRGLDLQIAKLRDRQERMADLLIDGAIDQNTYNNRKRSLTLELSRLTEERQNASAAHLSAEDMSYFLELMKNLAGLHCSAEPAEKRRLVENAFSNRTVSREYVELEPSDWLQKAKNASLPPLVKKY